jgi:alpha-beta hydrolase superfamily lysophospholipase
VNHGEGTLATAAGGSVYFQYWSPADQPRAGLLVAHGLAEHSGRYAHFAKFFTRRGYAVYALDFPGHGKSDGDSCHVGTFSEYSESVSLLREVFLGDFPGTDAFLVGHSMGGLVAASYLTERQSGLAGCILSGAAVRPAVEPPPIQQIIVRFLSRILPKLRVMQLDASQVSRDQDVVERYRNDPLVFSGKVTARLAEQLFGAMTALQEKFGTIELPMLILHGSSDGLTSPAGSQMLYERISSIDKKLIIYDGLYHEVYNEPEQETVMTDVADWIAAR